MKYCDDVIHEDKNKEVPFQRRYELLRMVYRSWQLEDKKDVINQEVVICVYDYMGYLIIW